MNCFMFGSQKGLTINYKIVVIAILILTSCTKSEVAKPFPIELTAEHACSVCGMNSADLHGAKAQIHYSNGSIDTFCSTNHMFSFNLQPDRPPNVTAVYVSDMGTADKDHSEGRWIDAESALYVYGGDVMGPHGEAFVSFSELKDAEGYVREHGGKIIKFDDVTMNMLRPNGHGHS